MVTPAHNCCAWKCETRPRTWWTPPARTCCWACATSSSPPRHRRSPWRREASKPTWCRCAFPKLVQTCLRSRHPSFLTAASSPCSTTRLAPHRSVSLAPPAAVSSTCWRGSLTLVPLRTPLRTARTPQDHRSPGLVKLALTLVRHKPRVHTSDAGTVAASTAEEEHVCLQVRAKLQVAPRLPPPHGC